MQHYIWTLLFPAICDLPCEEQVTYDLTDADVMLSDWNASIPTQPRTKLYDLKWDGDDGSSKAAVD